MNLEDGSWTVVRVGPTVVGWIGSNLPLTRGVVTRNTAINILAGDNLLLLDFLDLDRSAGRGVNLNKLWEELSIINTFGYYARHFAVPVPANALDIKDNGGIDLSQRSIEALCASLYCFFTAMSAAVQAELHLLTPVEVVRKMAELEAYGYPLRYLRKLTWRGGWLLTKFIESGMQVTALKRDDEEFKMLGFTPQENVSDMTFHGFLAHQTRTFFADTGTKRIAPENVFLVRASSNVEREEAKRMISNVEKLERFIDEVAPNAQEVSIFLCVEGDPAEEWVDGEVFSARDFLNLTGIRKDSHALPMVRGKRT